jgi:hypothetical protein
VAQGALLELRGCMDAEGPFCGPALLPGAVRAAGGGDRGGWTEAGEGDAETHRDGEGPKLAGRDFQMFRLHTDWPTRRCPAGARAHFCTLGAEHS